MRLPASAPLTWDDEVIWAHVRGKFMMLADTSRSSLSGPSVAADRRDADLMLSLVSHRANGAPTFLIRAGQYCGIGGPFRAFITLPVYAREGNITNFA